MVKYFFLLRKLILQYNIKVLYPIYRIIGLLYLSAISINCKIGSNVVIWKDIPDNTTVVYNEASYRKIK